MQYLGIFFLLIFLALAVYAIVIQRKEKLKQRELLPDGEVSANAEKVIGTAPEAEFELVQFRGEIIKMTPWDAWYFNTCLPNRTAKTKAWERAKKGLYPFPEMMAIDKPQQARH